MDENNTKIIFCSVSFDEGGKTYYYTTEDDTIEVGDEVVVPVGSDGNELTGTVEDVEYFAQENAPFPLDKVKSIICKSDEDDDYDEDDDDCEDEPEDEAILWDESKTELDLSTANSEVVFSINGLGNGDRERLSSCWCLVNLRIKNKFFNFELKDNEAFDFGELLRLRSKLSQLINGKIGRTVCVDFLEPTIDFELEQPRTCRIIVYPGCDGQHYVVPLHSDKTPLFKAYLDFCIDRIRKQYGKHTADEAEALICPRCGSANVATILWGMPAMDDKLQRQLDNKTVVLGGCCVTDNDPTHHCNDCKKDFGYPTAELESATSKVQFNIGGFFDGYEEVTVCKTEDSALVEVSATMPNYGESGGKKAITAAQWDEFIEKLYGCHITEWKKRYENKDILDGEQWELEVHYTDRKPLKIYGSNAYPPQFDKLRKLFDSPPWANENESEDDDNE